MITTETLHSRWEGSKRFLIYSTANDDPNYIADFLNFRSMTLFDPGVHSIDIYISVSLVSPISHADRIAISALITLTVNCRWLNVRGISWKGNIGRDFSSVAVGLRRISNIARSNDFVMVRNRSAYGPFTSAWYRIYEDQYFKHRNVGLAGSTINFLGHPRKPISGIATHVQTYVYASEWRHLEPLLTDYPGERCKDRLELINKGEIGLSQQMLGKGLGLTCLNWPDRVFTQAEHTDKDLPQGDVKARCVSLPLRYRFPAHLEDRTTLPQRWLWNAKIMTARTLGRRNSLNLNIEEAFLSTYD